MKSAVHLLLLSALAALPASAEAKPVPKTVEIRLDRFPTDPQRRQTTRLYLSSADSTIQCRTDSVPSHDIQVKRLKSLAAPFKAAKVTEACERSIDWGGKKACLDDLRNGVVNEVLRWCSNI